jgi:aryl-alcohol dehydrogenase-like predicted oxidoreductase
MERVIFGSSGLTVSPIAFGTWQLSPRFWGDLSKKDTIAAMRLAFDRGINFYDTADAYGDGHAETVLGEAIAGLPRDEVVVCTKFFNHFNPDASRYPDLSPAYLRERCDASLKRLRIDTIDVVLLHFYDQLTPLADVADTLNALREQGKIRHIGVSNHSVEQFRAQRRFANYCVAQPAYSLLAPEGETDFLPFCQADKIAVMIYSPLHKGLLTGKYTGTESFTDFRQHHADFQGERFKAICDAVQSLRPMAEKYGLSVYQLVLAATLMHPAIHVAVCGIKTPDQIAEAAGALGKTLDREDYFNIRKALDLGAAGKVLDAKGTKK